MLSRLRPRRREANADSISPAADAGAKVLAYLGAHGIPSTPRYYALIHAVLTDNSSIAAHAIAEATDGGVPMSLDIADAILAAMSGGNVQDAEEHERLRHQTLHLADLAANAQAATNRFGRDLSAGLGDVESDVRSVTAVLSSMLERTRATEQQLAAAVSEIEHLRDEVAEARNDAMRDELTGLLNRRGIIETIATLDAAQPRTVAVCDIDAFKAVNDSHGHEVGDRVLKVVAAALAEGCKPHLVGRWGGEEFIVVLDEADPARAAEIIDDVREELSYRRLRVRESGEGLGKITFSAGVATFLAGSFDPALRLADTLLYQAKVGGRNRVLSDSPEARAA